METENSQPEMQGKKKTIPHQLKLEKSMGMGLIQIETKTHPWKIPKMRSGYN